MSAPHLIVVSGLPASGKSTVGQLLSASLGMALIDKDAILEALFDSLGCADRERRHRLSRASDEILFTLAATSSSAVLVNWWDHETAPPRLRSLSPSLVEVYCDCPADLAASRFDARERHPGHQDRERSAEEIDEWIQRMRQSFRGPLRLSDRLITVDTSGPLDANAVVDRVRSASAR